LDLDGLDGSERLLDATAVFVGHLVRPSGGLCPEALYLLDLASLGH
jgi:hypothetical protein